MDHSVGADHKADARLHHSDEGSQYTTAQIQRLLADNSITCSMSRAGNVRDNSAMESFFSSLTIERTNRKVYLHRDEARADGIRNGAISASWSSMPAPCWLNPLSTKPEAAQHRIEISGALAGILALGGCTNDKARIECGP